MNNPHLLEAPSVPEINSLLVPLADRTLILPTVSVAEIVPWHRPDAVMDAPDWFMGRIHWRELDVPLLCYEALCGSAIPSMSTHSRIAVLNNTGVSEELPFFAIIAQAIPRLARLNANDIETVDGAIERPFVTMEVSVGGETAIIPDVAAIEMAFLSLGL